MPAKLANFTLVLDDTVLKAGTDQESYDKDLSPLQTANDCAASCGTVGRCARERAPPALWTHQEPSGGSE
jgi:hypothetical protein